MALDTEIQKEDVQQVIDSLSTFKSANFTEEEIQVVIDRYESEADSDPSATWNLIVENILYQLLNERPKL